MPPLMQIVTFVTITTITGFIFHKLNLNFFLGLAAGASVQFLLSYIVDSILTLYAAIKNKELENERIKEFSIQGIEVECPCHKKIKEFVPIKLNFDNKYKCRECQKTVSVIVEANTAIATQPIYDTSVSIENIPQLKEAA